MTAPAPWPSHRPLEALSWSSTDYVLPAFVEAPALGIDNGSHHLAPPDHRWRYFTTKSAIHEVFTTTSRTCRSVRPRLFPQQSFAYQGQPRVVTLLVTPSTLAARKPPPHSVKFFVRLLLRRREIGRGMVDESAGLL